MKYYDTHTTYARIREVSDELCREYKLSVLKEKITNKTNISYTNFQKNIFEDTSFLEKFFYNLLTNSNYELKNGYTHIDNIQSASENNLKGNNCTLEEQAIINILKVNPATTQEEIAIQISKSVRTVKTYMAEMQEKSLIQRKNGKKNGEWQVKV